MSYYFILRESHLLWEIKPQSCPKSPNCLENFIVLMLYMEVSKCWKTVELKWKIVTHFSRPKQQAEIIQPPKFSNCIVKWMIFFVSFCWHWDFLLENLKIKKKHWWCPLEPVDEYKKRCMPEIIFSKKELQIIWDFESFIFWLKFRFWGLL